MSSPCVTAITSFTGDLEEHNVPTASKMFSNLCLHERPVQIAFQIPPVHFENTRLLRGASSMHAVMGSCYELLRATC